MSINLFFVQTEMNGMTFLVPLEDAGVAAYLQPAACLGYDVSCDFLELFTHSARLSEACAAQQGLLVAMPVDLTQQAVTSRPELEHVWAALTSTKPRVVATMPP